MCGLTGFWARGTQQADLDAVATAMADRIRHRGPDDAGALATSPAEWKQALEALITDAALRKQMGATGRQSVEQMYSLQAQAPRLIEILKQAAG